MDQVLTRALEYKCGRKLTHEEGVQLAFDFYTYQIAKTILVGAIPNIIASTIHDLSVRRLIRNELTPPGFTFFGPFKKKNKVKRHRPQAKVQAKIRQKFMKINLRSLTKKPNKSKAKRKHAK